MCIKNWSLKLYTTRWVCASECLSGCLYNFTFVLLLSGCVRSYAQTRRDRTQFKGIPLLFYLPPPVPPCAVVWHTQGLHVYTQACNVTGVWPGGKTTESRSYKLSKEIPPLSTPIVPPVQIVLSETGPHLVSERRGRDFNFDIPNPIFFLLRITIFSMPVLGDEYIVFVYFWILLYVPSSAILSASSSRNVSVDMHYLE